MKNINHRNHKIRTLKRKRKKSSPGGVFTTIPPSGAASPERITTFVDCSTSERGNIELQATIYYFDQIHVVLVLRLPRVEFSSNFAFNNHNGNSSVSYALKSIISINHIETPRKTLKQKTKKNKKQANKHNTGCS